MFGTIGLSVECREYEISQPNELINDWDVCDWKFDYRNPRWRDNHTPEELKRFCCK